MINKGMTLFIAVVIMGLLLLISFAVLNITMKSTLFANSGRDSQYAFYAADAGIECALFWDSFDPSKFATSVSGGGGAPISCAKSTPINNNQAIPGRSELTLIGGTDANPISIFYFNMSQGEDAVNALPYCAIVTVEKRASDGKTYIKSKGYNTCDIANPRRVERGIEVSY